jgi:LDH2 family malate/lactate/ureidoglycolate dehydrogenase
MLRDFSKEQDFPRVPEAQLRETVIRIFEKMNIPADDCKLAADVLVTADMRAVESHGVSNLLRRYVQGYQQGTHNPNPQWCITRETPSTATIDCDRGLGIIIAPKAMDLAIEKARKVGIGMITMRNGGHLAMASYHAMRALRHDMIGLCLTASVPEMFPTFGAEPRLGTNPIALAAPADKEAPFVLTPPLLSSLPTRWTARRAGIKLPQGWIADASGAPS